jgi:hypothetical protein
MKCCMKLYVNILPLLLFCFGITLTAELQMPQKEEKKIFITVNEVELILKYRVSLLKMLYGSLTQEGLVIGRYQYGDQKYSIHTFSLCEKYAKQHKIRQVALASILEEAKKDFFEQTKEFLLSIEELRSVFFQMLQLDREKAPTKQYFFWFWRTKRDELDILKDEIETFQDLEHLLSSILEVLNTLLSGAQRATAQCYERIEKWQKIKACLSELEQEGFVDESFDTLSFLRFIKYNYLDVLRIGEFTKEQVEIILQEYIFSHS